MRVTLGELRDIGRRGARWRPPPPNTVIVTPSAIRKKALGIYHEESLSDALAYLDGRRPGPAKGLSGTYGPEGKRAQQGKDARRSFERYVRLDRQDPRPVAELQLVADVQVGAHEVSASVDVVLFTDDGYRARVLNWDKAGLNDPLADLLATPSALLVEQELGWDTCRDVELWDLRSGAVWQVDRRPALAAVDRLSRYLDRVESALGSVL